MQRFKNQYCGLHPDINPEFGTPLHQTIVKSVDGRNIDLTLELFSTERITRYSLIKRATCVSSTPCQTPDHKDGLIIKVFWVEESYRSKPDILAKENEISASVKNHVPEMVPHHMFSETTTAETRERLGISAGGTRVLFFQTLFPITKLVGDEFLYAWLTTVKCHLKLWKNGIHHRHVTPSNLMYYLDAEGKIVGVLNDFDLASMADDPSGAERTGVAAFMAVNLLHPRGVRGEVEHQYGHDAESFIWVLVWTSLRYDDGKLKEDRPLDKWLIYDANKCREKKRVFLYGQDWGWMPAGVGHEMNMEIAGTCLGLLLHYIRWVGSWDVDETSQRLLIDPVVLRFMCSTPERTPPPAHIVKMISE